MIAGTDHMGRKRTLKAHKAFVSMSDCFLSGMPILVHWGYPWLVDYQAADNQVVQGGQ
jgi:hypothetical protein